MYMRIMYAVQENKGAAQMHPVKPRIVDNGSASLLS